MLSQVAGTTDEIESSFGGMRFIAGQERGVAYKDGICTDPNAHVLLSPNSDTKCKCADGFLSSNGGKQVRDQDACVHCVGLEKDCHFSSDTKDICALSLQLVALISGFGSEPLRIEASLEIDSYTPLLIKDHGGGAVVHPHDAITLYGYASKTYKLETPYTVDRFTRLYFELTAKDDGDFIAICLNEDIVIRNSENALCFSLHGTSTLNENAYPTLPFNLAIGKPTAQSSQVVDHSPNFAVDGDEVTYMKENDNKYPVSKTLPESFPWFEVDMEREYMIKRVIIHHTVDRRVDILSDYNLMIYNNNGQIVFNYYGEKVTNPNTAPAEVVITMPYNIEGSRVRLILNGDSRIVSLRELKVEQAFYGPTRFMDLPIGRIKPGMNVRYLGFIQRTSNRSKVTNFQKFSFIYGYAKAATASPTASSPPTNSPSSATEPIGIADIPSLPPTEAPSIGG